MPRINPMELALPESQSETRQFTDPLQPGVKFSVSLRADPDYGLSLAAIDKGSTYITLYITGKKARDGKKAIAPTLPIGGRTVKMTASLCRVIAVLETLQSDPEPFAFQEWLALSACMPNAFGQIAEWSGDLMSKAAGRTEDDLPEG